jgi:hypothetical protein
MLTLRFAWLGWRLAGLREWVDDRRESVVRALGR